MQRPSVVKVAKEVQQLRKELQQLKRRLLHPDEIMTARERREYLQALREHGEGKSVSHTELMRELRS